MAVRRHHLQLRLVIIKLNRNLYLAQIFRMQAQLRRLLPLSGEQGDVLAQRLLPFAGTKRLAQYRCSSDRGGGLRGGLAADDRRKRCRWAGGRGLGLPGPASQR